MALCAPSGGEFLSGCPRTARDREHKTPRERPPPVQVSSMISGLTSAGEGRPLPLPSRPSLRLHREAKPRPRRGKRAHSLLVSVRGRGSLLGTRTQEEVRAECPLLGRGQGAPRNPGPHPGGSSVCSTGGNTGRPVLRGVPGFAERETALLWVGTPWPGGVRTCPRGGEQALPAAGTSPRSSAAEVQHAKLPDPLHVAGPAACNSN